MHMPFDEDAMMVMLELPEEPGKRGENPNRKVEHGPMEGMDDDSEKLLKKIYCMLKCHFDGEDACDEEDEENEDEL